MNTDDKKDFFDKPENVSLMLKIFYACCAILFILDFVIDRYTYHPLENMWGFYPAYGFVGCVVLVVIAKWMRLFIMRDEDYYDKDEQRELDRIKASSAQEDHHVGH